MENWRAAIYWINIAVKKLKCCFIKIKIIISIENFVIIKESSIIYLAARKVEKFVKFKSL